MNEIRRKRIAQAIRDAVATILRQRINDPRIGFVTITDVTVSTDFKHVQVFYSVIGSQRRVDETKIGLSSATKLITREVAAKLDLRQMPSLRFVFDETPSKAQKLEMTFLERKDDQDKPESDGSNTQKN